MCTREVVWGNPKHPRGGDPVPSAQSTRTTEPGDPLHDTGRRPTCRRSAWAPTNLDGSPVGRTCGAPGRHPARCCCGPHANTAANTGETPVADTIPEPWAEWDEWAALAEKEARSHNYRDPALSSSSENDPGSLHEPPPTPHACGIR